MKGRMCGSFLHASYTPSMTRLHPALSVLGLTVAIAGCAARQGERRARDVSGGEVDGRSLERADERVVPTPLDDEGAARAPTLTVRDAPHPRFTTLRIGASEARPARPPRRKHIDLDLKDAAVGNVLQFIADAGGFNLVVEGELAALVTLRLRDVDPFDALATVAEAEGLNVEMERGIVIVTARGSARIAGAGEP